MDHLSPHVLLDVWERGMARPTSQRALLLLSAAFPEEPVEVLAQLSVGRRNALLLALRERLFGSQFVSVAVCPECGERLELHFEAADIRAPTLDAPVEPPVIEMAGYVLRFRLPDSTDLAAIQEYEQVAAGQQALLERCLLSAQCDGQEVPATALPAEVVAALAAAMEQADPLANVELALSCPACGHHWSAVLDLPAYVWSELDAWARRVLREVHYLASAYGWSEAEILNMQPWRRNTYLEMIGR